jgi:hypothetical protein
MSEASISQPGPLLWQPTGLLPSDMGCEEYRPASAAELPALPILRPGQLWYVELPSAEPTLAPLEHLALTTANVVVYDRALAPTVARFLPIGGYAEPAAPSDGASDASLERCLRFTRDGWSVARLIDPGRERVGMIRQLSERLLRANASVSPVMVFANAGGAYENSKADLDQLGDIIDARRFDQPVTLTIIFSGLDVKAAPRFAVASANGLAG